MIGSALGAMHLTAAVIAMVFGAVVLGAQKGTTFHRIIGAGHVVAMLLLGGSALAVHRLTGHFQPFHALALLSVATVLRAIVPVLRRRPGWLMAHYWNMAWSYIALLAAACSEVVARLLLHTGAFKGPGQVIAGGLGIAVVFVALGMIMLPRLQRSALAMAQRSPQ